MLLVSCGGETSAEKSETKNSAGTDTIAMSKSFIQAAMKADKAAIKKIADIGRYAGLTSDNNLPPTTQFLNKNFKSADELSYTVQKGKTSNVECVIVKNKDGRKAGDYLLLNWKLKFRTEEKSKAMRLYKISRTYSYFTDKGCKE